MRARRTDKAHKAVLDAIRAMGLPCMSLHAAGNGLEDIIVGIQARWMKGGLACTQKRWVMVEVKTVETKTTGYVRHTEAQKEWYALTPGFPRLIVTSAEDAKEKLNHLRVWSEELA